VKRQKPTRRDLLIVVTRLQSLISGAATAHGNDRDPSGFEKGQAALAEAFTLAVDARSFDPPLDGAVSRHGWGKA
jgi:hypothetical protein